MNRSVVGHWQEKLQTHCHEFKCHATDAMVADGRVRRDDKEGHDAADIAPDFGRLRQPEMVIDVYRNLLCLKKEWYSRVLVLHRLMVAVAREALNHSGGIVRWWIRWFGAEVPSQRFGGLVVEMAGMPVPPGFLGDSSWTPVDSGPITGADISAWSFSIPMLVKFTAFLSTLRWPEG